MKDNKNMLIKTAQLSEIKRTSLEKGFTLVELLIVIAILGVLAAVVLVAINPIEQLARGADAGRESAVSQLGRATLNWETSQQVSDFSTLTAASWQTVLVTANEIKNQVTVNAAAACGANSMGGVCYTTASSNTVALVWTVLASKSETTRGQCSGATPIPIALYDSGQGKEGVACVATAATVPGANLTLR